MKELNKRRLDPRAWNRKYLTAASVSLDQVDIEIKGIKEIIFTSREAQIISQWEEDKARIELNRSVEENKDI